METGHATVCTVDAQSWMVPGWSRTRRQTFCDGDARPSIPNPTARTQTAAATVARRQEEFQALGEDVLRPRLTELNDGGNRCKRARGMPGSRRRRSCVLVTKTALSAKTSVRDGDENGAERRCSQDGGLAHVISKLASDHVASSSHRQTTTSWLSFLGR